MKKNNLQIVAWSLKKAWQICPVKLVLWTVVSLFSAALAPVYLYITSNVIDTVNREVSRQASLIPFILPIALLAFFLFLRGVYGLLVTAVKQIFIKDMQAEISRMIMEQSARIPVATFDDDDFIKMLYLCANSENTANAGVLAQGMITVVGKLASVVTLLAMAARISWIFFAGTLCLIIISILICVHIAKKRYQVEKETIVDNRWKGYYFSCTGTQESGREIRTLNLEDVFVKKWRSVADPLREELLEIEYAKNKGLKGIDLLSVLLSTAMLAGGVLLLRDTLISMGTMFLIWQLNNEIQSSVKSFVNEFLEPYAAIPKVRDIQEFLDLDFHQELALGGRGEARREENSRTEPFLELRDVSFGYRTEKTILKHINLKINRGEIVALCGTNGSGKTTLINIMTGMYKAQEGECLLEGRSFGQVSPGELAAKMGVDFQHFMVFGFPLREEVALGKIESLEDEAAIVRAIVRGGAEKLMKRVGLERCMGTLYDVNGLRLSGGEYQRIGVCRAFMGDKGVLVLDEPASMLDPIAEFRQFQQVKNAIENQTAILISHRIGFARLADRILVMDDGRIVEDGNHEELMKRNGVYRQMFDAQADWYDDIA